MNKLDTENNSIEDKFMVDEKEFYELKGEVSSIKTEVSAIKSGVDRIERKLFGNGSEGLVEIVAKQGENIAELYKVATEFALSMTEFRRSLETCTSKISAVDPKNWIVKHWKILIFTGIAVFLVIHSLIPIDMTIWEAIKAIP